MPPEPIFGVLAQQCERSRARGKFERKRVRRQFARAVNGLQLPNIVYRHRKSRYQAVANIVADKAQIDHNQFAVLVPLRKLIRIGVLHRPADCGDESAAQSFVFGRQAERKVMLSGKITVFDFDAQIVFAFLVDVDIGRGDNGAVFLERERQAAVIDETKIIVCVVEMPDGERVDSNRVADDNWQIQSQRVEQGDEARRRAGENFLIDYDALARQAQGDYS